LARITPHTRGKCDDIEKTSMIESAQTTLGHKRKFSIIKGAQTKLGGMMLKIK